MESEEISGSYVEENIARAGKKLKGKDACCSTSRRDVWPPAYLLERKHDHKISVEELKRPRVWIESKPEVREGAWCEDFGSFKLCGETATPWCSFVRI